MSSDDRPAWLDATTKTLDPGVWLDIIVASSVADSRQHQTVSFTRPDDPAVLPACVCGWIGDRYVDAVEAQRQQEDHVFTEVKAGGLL
jgi:hypothetical protein